MCYSASLLSSVSLKHNLTHPHISAGADCHPYSVRSMDFLKSSRGRSRTRGRRSTMSRGTGHGPEDEQSSWIADDICAHCGSVAPQGKLYCSIKCRNADTTSATSSTKHDQAAVVLNDSLNQLRYPVTLSPRLTASSTKTATYPTAQTEVSKGICCDKSHSVLSSETDQLIFRSFPMRKNSHSSRSDGSDLNDSDTTSPSPWKFGLDTPEHIDAISDVDEAELCLPPSLDNPSHFPDTTLSAPKLMSSQSASHTPKVRPFCPSSVLRPTTSSHSDFVCSPILFRRIPGTTNMPSAVGYGKTQSASMCAGSRGVQNTTCDCCSIGSCIPELRWTSTRQSSLERPTERIRKSATISCVPSKAEQDFSGTRKGAMIMSKASSSNVPSCNKFKPDEHCSSEQASCHCEEQLSPCLEAMDSCDDDEPQRGRPRNRVGHSCCGGHRSSIHASCHTGSLPCTDLLPKASFDGLVHVPRRDMHENNTTGAPIST